jgi:predicted amidohydrolase
MLSSYWYSVQMGELCIAMASDVFFGEGAKERLVARLREAKNAGADLAVLPEIACNPWSPSTKNLRDEDAEELGGMRCSMQSEAAKEVGIGLIGSAILKQNGERYNTCLFWDDKGELLGTYQKHHIPEEDGFWETSHYSESLNGFPIFHFRGFNIGIQICSDMNRPQGSHLLAAAGADVIVGPRSTELATYDKWRPVWIANALTTGCYICSVNRPAPEDGVLIGGNSIAVAPDGEVLIESCDAITVFTVRQSTIKKVRKDYPGYLPYRSELYAQGWNAIKDNPR